MIVSTNCGRLMVYALAALCACNQSVKPEPIEECKQYEAALTSCFHRDSGFASQESVLPNTKADRERIRELCSQNLARIKRACPR
jgi:hypothetical protein